MDWKKFLKATQAFVITHYLPISFSIAIIWALVWPEPGIAVGSVTILDNIHVIQEINMIIVFFISGLVLKTEDIKAAWKHKFGCIYGLVTILFITPLLAFAIKEIPLTPPEYTTGLTILSVVPTTLGIGVSLVRSCKGNEGLALLLTVVSNLCGVVTIPLWLKAVFHDDDSLDFDFNILSLFVRLVITIFVPSFLGKLLRETWKPAKRFATKYKTALSITATTNLAMFVWQSLSGAQEAITGTPFIDTLYAILLAAAQHIFYLIMNCVAVSYVFRMALPEAIATAIMGSQKSAPVAVTVITNLQASLSQQGLFAVPCICSQIFQIFFGSLMTPYLSRKMVAYNRQQALLKDSLPTVKNNSAAEPGSGDSAKNDTSVAESAIKEENGLEVIVAPETVVSASAKS